MSVPQPQVQQPPAPQSNVDLFGGIKSPGLPSQIKPPTSNFPRPLQAARSTPDPFAALTSPTSRQASPFQFQQSVKPQSTGTVDLLGVGSPPPPSNLVQNSTNTANDDDEWTFTSAVPDTSKEITVVNSSVTVVFKISRESDTVLLIQSRISNNTPAPISALTFQSAVSKVRTLH
jgi:ADP-ribosylation factor-binding protein GGA